MSNISGAEPILMSVDYGETNVGLAFGRNGLVSPLRVISAKDDETAIHEIARTAFEIKPEKFIVGLPLTVDGKETPQARRTKRFAKLLKVLTKKPVDFQNEYGTTILGEAEAIRSGVSRKKRRITDHFSAALILKNYYDEQQ